MNPNQPEKTTPAAPAKPVPANLIVLDFPFETVGGRKITELTMRRPKVRDMKQAARDGGSDAEIEVRLFAAALGILPEDLDEMDLVDYKKVQEVYQNSFRSGTA